MKVTIIEPYHLDGRYDVRSLSPSPGPVVVASLLNQHGHKAQVISEYVTKLTDTDLDWADLVGISITTYNAVKGYKIARQIRKPVVFGGFHASLMPEECLAYGDYAIKGDGHSIVKLADYLDNKGVKDLSHIPNLAYRRNGKICHNFTETAAVGVTPDYRLVKDYYKFNLNRLLRIPLLVNASRGCRQDCSFCSIKAVYPDYRKKDIRIVMEDIKSQIQHRHILAKFFPKIIWITDDNFASDRRWAKELLRELALLEHDYCFTVQARVDIVKDDELLSLMKKARINRVYLGIESLDQESLNRFNKSSSPAAIELALEKLKKHGIDVHGLFVFGDDKFQKGDGRRVADFVERHGLSGVLIQPLTPYPGTKLYKTLESQNRILHRNWEHYNGKVVFKPKNMTPAELQDEIYSCYRRVFSLRRVIRFFFRGNRGWKFEFLGEAVFRYFENLKMNRYRLDHSR